MPELLSWVAPTLRGSQRRLNSVTRTDLPIRDGVVYAIRARTHAPINSEATSGKVTRRHRLNRGGNRQANHALWRIVFTRLGSDARTRIYVARRLDDGRSRPEIIRSLKRYVARATYRQLPR